jgi:hypothetical protein
MKTSWFKAKGETGHQSHFLMGEENSIAQIWARQTGASEQKSAPYRP